ncbi:DUF2612 domain-containing protein [Campylobacter concisus]|uniref:DUF2612 domain-containing protein n=1 Tax=Campylobacter concisus TaxID=199 RepID=UPI0009FF30CE|nr:DUF2612 domain-containing protein [Campylobacter concisus]ORI00274.1 hypothetical protein A3223_07675 [Campylobacter concisus]
MVELIWQYRKKPRAKATAKLLNDEVYKAFDDAIKVAEILNIDTASGYALDLVGRHVGVSREQQNLILKDFFAFTQTEKKQGFNKGEFYRLGNSLKGSFYLNDSDYRFLIKAKIIKNYQTGTLENSYKSLEFLLGAGNFIFDNYDMTLNLVLKNAKTTQFLINLIFKNDILARPIGVGLNVILIADKKCFGFKQNKANLAFGVGKFAKIYKEK